MSKFKVGDRVAVYQVGRNPNGDLVAKRDTGTIVTAKSRFSDSFVDIRIAEDITCLAHEKQCRKLKNKNMNEWINVKDCLHKLTDSLTATKVLAYLKSGDIDICYRSYDGRLFFKSYDDVFPSIEVTHWMPLPKTPAHD